MRSCRASLCLPLERLSEVYGLYPCSTCLLSAPVENTKYTPFSPRGKPGDFLLIIFLSLKMKYFRGFWQWFGLVISFFQMLSKPNEMSSHPSTNDKAKGSQCPKNSKNALAWLIPYYPKSILWKISEHSRNRSPVKRNFKQFCPYNNFCLYIQSSK